MNVSLIRYGATLTSFFVPDRSAVPRDVALGFDVALDYCARSGPDGTAAHPYFGAAIGRVANRIANGTFQIDGVTYTTPVNEAYAHAPTGHDGSAGGDTLHGGTIGFDRRVWTVLDRNASSVTFTLLSQDGDMGFPGDLLVKIRYTLTNKTSTAAPTWDVAYSAVTSAPATLVALSQHTYWNLNANIDNVETALEHVVSIAADAFVEVDANLIPTGALPFVAGSPWMDFRTPKPLGRDIANGTVAPGGGYDNAWIWLDAWQPGVLAPRVTMASPLTGIALELRTDQPSVQGYSCNFLGSQPGGLVLPRKASQCQGGVAAPNCTYQHFGCFVLEAQHLPDTPHNDAFPSITLRHGDVYQQHTVYAFTSV